MEKRAGSKTQDMAYIALFAVVMAVCAWIVIPMVVPFTLQTFAVFLAVGVLGGKRGTFAILLYLLLGIIGIPVFSGFTGGIGVLLGNTGGYLVGFLCTSLIMWGMERLFGKKNMGTLAVHGVRPACLLWLRNSLVYDSIYKKYRNDRDSSRTGILCNPIYYSGFD